MCSDNTSNEAKNVIIIGAGPAGLTAALELVRQSNLHPIVLEADSLVGGISRTVEYKGNRIDIGGHRFFSKSDWVMKWWKDILPVAISGTSDVTISYHGKTRAVETDETDVANEKVMLVRPRLSRIYYEGHFYDYPIKINFNTIMNLGLPRLTMIALSYIRYAILPIKERNLEDFLTNRFGRKLYKTFFESYTEKVWGVPCREISSEWGAQRIKGLSVGKALMHFLLSPFRNKNIASQKKGETSLIEQFLYPKYGPGQMWETVAEMVIQSHGELHLHSRVTRFVISDNKISDVIIEDNNGESRSYRADYVISTMPVKDLINAMSGAVPVEVKNIAQGLPYRDFLTVGLLLKRFSPNPQSRTSHINNMPPDNWIYIQDPQVRLGRLQIFNNWSPAMVHDQNSIWVGLEYFCNEGDDLWDMDDEQLARFAGKELETIGLISQNDILDNVVIRIPKAYPAYFGTYDEFNIVREFTDKISNLYLVGRNGMHRYNNQDHSMLAAKACVESILSGDTDKNSVWDVNSEEEYHEERQQ